MFSHPIFPSDIQDLADKHGVDPSFLEVDRMHDRYGIIVVKDRETAFLMHLILVG